MSDLEDSKSAQDEFIALIRDLLLDTEEDSEIEAEMPAAAVSLDGRDLIDRMGRPGLSELSDGGADAASLGDFWNGVKGGALNTLNLFTYYKMKKRSAKVGQNGLVDCLHQAAAAQTDRRLHLVGHSFGARLATAAALGRADKLPPPIASLSLLQAAFSHFAFAQNFDGDRDGFFRQVIENTRIGGPIIVSHTKNDRAVGVAYPLASRLSGTDASALDDDSVSRFGGLGRNGARSTPEADFLTMKAGSDTYSFAGDKISNLLADDFIDSHGDVRNPAVANAVLFAMASSS